MPPVGPLPTSSMECEFQLGNADPEAQQTLSSVSPAPRRHFPDLWKEQRRTVTTYYFIGTMTWAKGVSPHMTYGAFGTGFGEIPERALRSGKASIMIPTT